MRRTLVFRCVRPIQPSSSTDLMGSTRFRDENSVRFERNFSGWILSLHPLSQQAAGILPED